MFNLKMLRKFVFFMSLLIATNAKAQQTFNVSEMRFSSVKRPGSGKSIQTQMVINVSDSVFTTSSEGKQFSYQIIKKLNDNNFTISDGTNEYHVKIRRLRIEKFSGFINQELEEGYLTYFF